MQDWKFEQLHIYIKELEKSVCSGSTSKTNNVSETLLSPKRLVKLKTINAYSINKITFVFVEYERRSS